MGGGMGVDGWFRVIRVVNREHPALGLARRSALGYSRVGGSALARGHSGKTRDFFVLSWRLFRSVAGPNAHHLLVWLNHAISVETNGSLFERHSVRKHGRTAIRIFKTMTDVVVTLGSPHAITWAVAANTFDLISQSTCPRL